MKITFVVAYDNNKAIGKDGQLPWHLPNDLKWFKKNTVNKMVVMGRTTWESLPKAYKPLPNRVNLVLTRKKDYNAAGAIVCNSLQEVLTIAMAKKVEELAIVGGGQIYELFYPITDEMIVTEVDTIIKKADTHFVDFEEKDWFESFEEPHAMDEKHEFNYTFKILKRVIDK